MLHADNKLFTDIVLATAEYFSISPIYIEKDYWITHSLRLLAQNDNAAKVVFKGGTSLSKAYNLVDRFSEDINIVILKAGDESGNQLKNKIKKISQVVSAVLPEIDVPGITNKFGMIRKTAHSYQKNFDGKFGQVRDNIILVINLLRSKYAERLYQ